MCHHVEGSYFRKPQNGRLIEFINDHDLICQSITRSLKPKALRGFDLPSKCLCSIHGFISAQMSSELRVCCSMSPPNRGSYSISSAPGPPCCLEAATPSIHCPPLCGRPSFNLGSTPLTPSMHVALHLLRIRYQATYPNTQGAAYNRSSILPHSKC